MISISNLLFSCRFPVRAVLFAVACLQAFPANACESIDGESADVSRLHFLVPGGAGGGWDSTARAVGEALRRSGLASRVSYENRSGGGGGVAIAHFIETAGRQQNTVFVGSTALVIRSLSGLLPQDVDELVPIASVVADYGALVVRADSPLEDFAQLSVAVAANPSENKVAGGSVRGGMDHLVLELAMIAAGHPAGRVPYVAYDAGGQALTSLLSGETQVLSTGVSEVAAASHQGQVRILAITSPQRLPELPEVPTLLELGVNAQFANWRGFFGPPGMTRDERERIACVIETMTRTPEWETQRSRLALTNFVRRGAAFDAFLRDNRRQLDRLMDSIRAGTQAATQ